jgi:hypothetical protein
VVGAELDETRRIVAEALAHRPAVRSSAFPG